MGRGLAPVCLLIAIVIPVATHDTGPCGYEDRWWCRGNRIFCRASFTKKLCMHSCGLCDDECQKPEPRWCRWGIILWGTDFCKRPVSWKYCKKTCGLCDGTTTPTITTTSTTASTTASTTTTTATKNPTTTTIKTTPPTTLTTTTTPITTASTKPTKTPTETPTKTPPPSPTTTTPPPPTTTTPTTTTTPPTTTTTPPTTPRTTLTTTTTPTTTTTTTVMTSTTVPTDVWIVKGDKQYKVLDLSSRKSPLIFSEAQRLCIAEGGVLPDPMNAQQNDHLASLQVPSPIYLGMQDEYLEGFWRYGSVWARVTWFNWMEWDVRDHEPNGGSSENCVKMLNDGDSHHAGHSPDGWADVPCGPSHVLPATYVVCERAAPTPKSTKPTTTTTKPTLPTKATKPTTTTTKPTLPTKATKPTLPTKATKPTTTTTSTTTAPPAICAPTPNSKPRDQDVLSDGTVVLCDTETDGGGWIILQQNVPGQVVSFDRDWLEYKTGFGGFDTNYWLGLDTLHSLCGSVDDKCELRVEIDYRATGQYAEYSWFYIGSEKLKYFLVIGGFSGTAGDAMMNTGNTWGPANGMPFSTRDRDNDNWTGGNCPIYYRNGWWFNSCTSSNVNGDWNGGDSKVFWNLFDPTVRTELKLRRRN